MSQKSDRQSALDKGGQSISKHRSLKQQIRDTKRLLAKDDIPETVRLTKERIMRSLQGELNDKISKKQKQKVSKKYRMVKFFEKRKVVRKLNRACREYHDESTDDTERSELLGDIHQLRRELNYIVHFPPDNKYIALYPSSTPSSETALAKQVELLQSISESVENGDLPDATSLEKCLLIPDSQTSSHQDILQCGQGTVKHKSSLHSQKVPELSKEETMPREHLSVSREQTQSRERKTPQKRKQRCSSKLQGDECDMHVSARKRLKEDGFFLADSDNSD